MKRQHCGQTDGLFKSTQLMMVAGLDYAGISNSLVSIQVFEDHVFKNISMVGRRQSETYASLLMNHSMKNEIVTAEIIGVQSLSSGGGFVRPSVKYQLKSSIVIKAELISSTVLRILFLVNSIKQVG